MKRKTIRKTLRHKLEELIKSVEDEELKELLKDNTIITGGCITSMLLQEDVNDYDLYFKNVETAQRVAEYFVEKYKSSNNVDYPKDPDTNEDLPFEVRKSEEGVEIYIKSAGVLGNQSEEYQYFENFSEQATEEYVEKVFLRQRTNMPEFTPMLITSNAITLKGNIQLILRFCGEPEDIHKNFDFVHATNYYKSWDDELILKEEALESILTKELKYIGSKYPVCSLFRLRKFLKRGWRITAGEIFKIAYQVSELSLEDTEILQDQLIGVDEAYFQEVANKVKEEVKDGKEVDKTYLFQIIDNVFAEEDN